MKNEKNNYYCKDCKKFKKCREKFDYIGKPELAPKPMDNCNSCWEGKK